MHDLKPLDTVTDATDKPSPWPRRWQLIKEYATDPGTWVVTAVLAAGIGILVSVAYGVIWLIQQAIDVLSGGATAIGTGFDSGNSVILDPIRSYLNANAGHIAADRGTLWWAWITVTIALFVLATTGARGARIGWTVIGGITTAMVWAGSTPDSRALAAGITLAVWSVLSIAAFNRCAAQQDDPNVIVIQQPAPRTEEDETVAAVSAPPWPGRGI
jgi:hypothetical protein